MGKHQCSRCKKIYYVNPDIDNEFTCPKCGLVENERMIGQKTGRRDSLFDE